jgi:DnaJ-class molecular chaperone
VSATFWKDPRNAAIQSFLSFFSPPVLGIPEGSSEQDVKRAYRRLAVTHHPDRGGDPKKFQEIKAAHDKLTGVADEEEERQQGPSQRIRPIQKKITVTLQELYTGCTKQV